MLTEFVAMVDTYSNIVNFICYTLVFFGGFYVALHSRLLPTWASTSIWYLGVSSFFVATTIVVEWVFGQHHPFSHFMMGHFGEMIINLNLAIMVGFLFFHTVYQDFRNKKDRKMMRRKEDRLEL